MESRLCSAWPYNLDFVHCLQRASQTTPSTCPIDVNNCIPAMAAHKPAGKP